MANLEPCPFCGGEDLKIDTGRTKNLSSHWVSAVICQDCFSTTGTRLKETEAESIADAIEFWNTRPLTTIPDSLEHCTLDEIGMYVRNLQAEVKKLMAANKKKREEIRRLRGNNHENKEVPLVP